MTLPEHTFTFNLLKLVSPDLALSLGTLLRKASRDKEKIVALGVQMRENGLIRHLNIIIKPFSNEKKLSQKTLLVILQEVMPQTSPELSQEVFWSDTHHQDRAQELEVELQHTKDDLQTVVEELETSNEELQSTNEELLSSNEELQSTNEELQSLNEELQTINSEHQYKIKALMELDDDLNNYFRSTNIGQIFVDRHLVIRKFTPFASRQINLIESDIGRPISQISHNLRYDKLIDDIRQVTHHHTTLETEVQDLDNIWYQMRILPYITQDQGIDGAIIIFINIHEIKMLQLLQEGIMDLSPNAILALKAIRSHGGVITDFEWSILNKNTEQLVGQPQEKLIGKMVSKTFPKLLGGGLFDAYVRVVEAQEHLDLEQQLCPEETQQWFHIVGSRMNDGLVLTLLNITQRKLNEQILKQQQEEIQANAGRFKMLLEALPHITWTSNADGRIMSYNQRWYDYSGLEPAGNQEWAWKKVIHADDLEKALASFQENNKKTANIFSAEVRLRRRDGQYRWHLARAVPIVKESGEISMWIGSCTDIQDQKEDEAAIFQLRLKQQKEILKAVLNTQEAERVRISEALHNSLGQILYATRLKVEEFPQENGMPKGAHDKTLDLLNQAIITTRNISFELTPSILKDFGMKIALEELIQRLQGSKIHIDCDIEGFEERPDYLVELSLYRIIQELINNILKHSGATRAFIELVKDANQIMLKVKDNGKGFDYEKLEKQKGLGLSSIRNRADLLGGTMKIDSHPGKGTLVTITVKQKD
jgi:two-component system CheB/CheR fusion protein